MLRIISPQNVQNVRAPQNIDIPSSWYSSKAGQRKTIFLSPFKYMNEWSGGEVEQMFYVLNSAWLEREKSR